MAAASLFQGVPSTSTSRRFDAQQRRSGIGGPEAAGDVLRRWQRHFRPQRLRWMEGWGWPNGWNKQSNWPATGVTVGKAVAREQWKMKANLKMYFLLRKWGCSIAMSVYQRVYTPSKSKECSKNSAWKTIWLPFDPWLYIVCWVKGLFVKGKALVDL